MQERQSTGFKSQSLMRYFRNRASVTIRDLISPVTLLAILWVGLIYWNERLVFSLALQKCEWERWETWPREALPHRLALIADPQLVDPHTYPGRPWPLSTLTIIYTDLYLRRVHRLLQRQLYPDTTIFLGDLFDGGREWSTGQSSSPEERYRKYGESFWHKEYRRFSSIFFDTWSEAGVLGRAGQPARRKIIMNIPGNHDLGFASGIQEPVRKRFNAYFGDGNAVSLIGNHTFVSLDTVSFSAKEESEAPESLWRPTQEFLDAYQALIHRTMKTQISQTGGLGDHVRMQHKVLDGTELAMATNRKMDHGSLTYPTVLLSHVPLYRDQGTPCGPLREKWPPSMGVDGKPLENDERNAISVSRGYQYQNVLSPEISKEITSKLETVSYAFSGDDHDYCETVHRRYPSAGSGILEITVKSISWAMGIRRPGLQLASLWNPIEGSLIDKHEVAAGRTIQNHLCLLPDQLAIFLHYILLLGFTLLVASCRASYVVMNSKTTLRFHSLASSLPVMQSDTELQWQSSSSTDGAERSITKRSRLGVPTTTWTSSESPSPRSSHSYGLPIAHDPYERDLHGPSSGIDYFPGFALYLAIRRFYPRGNTAPPQGLALFSKELRGSMIKVVLIVLPCYLWLIRRG